MDAGIGLPGLLAALPAGPHDDLVRRRNADGVISGWADTESTGAANDRPWTVATPVDGGAAYTLTGSKVFISNGAVADELIVAAASHPLPAAASRCSLWTPEPAGSRSVRCSS